MQVTYGISECIIPDNNHRDGCNNIPQKVNSANAVKL